MIAFGCATTSEEEYSAYVVPSLDRVAEPDSHLMRRHGYDSIHEPYNEMLAEAAEFDDLEALVLLHQDLSIEDEEFMEKIRGLLAASPEVAVLGAAGARGIPGLAWWEGESFGRIDAPRLVPGGAVLQYGEGSHEVDAVDGMLLVLSPWAVRELRFDADLAGPLDGYDIDFCLQARAKGARVIATSLSVRHHVPYEEFFDRRRWVDAAIALQRKWRLELAPPRL